MYTVIQADISHLKDISYLFDQYRIFYEKKSDLGRATEFISERMINKKSIIFACYKDKLITSFVQLYPLFSSTRMRKLWLLNDLYVAADHRGNGISKLLIEKCKELCRQTGACGLTLETAKSNQEGNQLYPSMGFHLESESNFYSWDSDHN